MVIVRRLCALFCTAWRTQRLRHSTSFKFGFWNSIRLSSQLSLSIWQMLLFPPDCFQNWSRVLSSLLYYYKAGLDTSDVKNFRPVSNLFTLSKLLERLAVIRLKPHICSSSNWKTLQSAYSQGHSTETALCKILDDIIGTVDIERFLRWTVDVVFFVSNLGVLSVLLCMDLVLGSGTVDWLERLVCEMTYVSSETVNPANSLAHSLERNNERMIDVEGEHDVCGAPLITQDSCYPA